MTVYIIVSALAIMLASLGGLLFVWHGLEKIVQENLSYLATFAMGIFVIIFSSIIEETGHLSLPTSQLFFGLLAGALLLEFFTRLIPDAHHHHEIEPHHHSRLDARKMLLGDAIHNIGDGILLTASFLASPVIGLFTAGAIFLHELVQEISQFFVLREAGYPTQKALALNFLASATILIGVIIGWYFGEAEHIVAPLIALAGGGFLYIIFRDLLPHAISCAKNHGGTPKHIMAFILGLVLMFTISTLAPHEHEHSEVEEAPANTTL